MTQHTADDLFPEAPEPVTSEQLATEPAHPALRAWQLSAPAHDALALRIEAAAAAELTRRREAAAARVGRPQLTVLRGDPRSAGRDLTPLFARALRPALVAAAAAALFAIGFAQQGNSATEAVGQQVSDATAVQALSLHDPSAQWADQARAPTVDALGRAIGLGGAP